MNAKLKYMAELDGLRAIAVGSVLFAHFVPVKYQISLPFGSAGVQLFFVLSGFLITSILLRSKDVKLSQSQGDSDNRLFGGEQHQQGPDQIKLFFHTQ